MRRGGCLQLYPCCLRHEALRLIWSFSANELMPRHASTNSNPGRQENRAADFSPDIFCRSLVGFFAERVKVFFRPYIEPGSRPLSSRR